MRKRIDIRTARLALLAALALLLGACALHKPTLGPMPVSVAEPPPAVEPYRIQPGDELDIRYFHTPDQNVTLPVRPDGYISLPLVYELQVAGRTVEEVRKELTERLSTELVQPEVAVIVRTFSGYVVHVGGEVGKPGVVALTGQRTVLEAVFEAGGFLPTASPADVIVVRRRDPSGYELVAANLDDVLWGRNASGNFPLRPYDVVYVPTSPIADVNKFIDQYIDKNLPINFTYRLDNNGKNN